MVTMDGEAKARPVRFEASHTAAADGGSSLPRRHRGDGRAHEPLLLYAGHP